jgi:hypothetical protein|tara:strand:+ start:756 stop:1127 length:372 start_codon:yes stop_codon:yes gene_type:complete
MKDKQKLLIVLSFIDKWATDKEVDSIYEFSIIHSITDWYKKKKYITIKQYIIMERMYWKWRINDTVCWGEDSEYRTVKEWFSKYYVNIYDNEDNPQFLGMRLEKGMLYKICAEKDTVIKEDKL